MSKCVDPKLAPLLNERAIFSTTPVFSGDGYGYGGAAVLTIGPLSVHLGETPIGMLLARELAARWNAALHDRQDDAGGGAA
jgi:hypothetical protein